MPWRIQQIMNGEGCLLTVFFQYSKLIFHYFHIKKATLSQIKRLIVGKIVEIKIKNREGKKWNINFLVLQGSGFLNCVWAR